MSSHTFSRSNSALWGITLTCLALAAMLLSLRAQAATLPGPVVTPAELRPLVDQRRVTVLDTRELFQTDGKTPNFSAGHIPGALPAPYSDFRGPNENPGAPLAIEKLNVIVNRLGLSPERPIVLAGSGADPTEFGGPARIYWTLKAAGFRELAILNGGVGAWMAAKFPLEQGDAPKVKAGAVKLSYRPEAVLSTQSLIRMLSGPADQRPLLIDARPEEFFVGDMRHPAAARWGTLPGAKHYDSAEWFVPNTGRLLSSAELRQMAQQEGFLDQRPTVSFCNAGHWAATHWFILHEVLGQSQVQMYPESVVGWSKTAQPMDNTPSRSTVLMRQLKGTGVMK